MSIYLLIMWIMSITSFTLLGSWYARKFNRSDLLIGLYVTFVIVAQISASKISAFDLGFSTFYGPSGVLLFSITYLLTDIVNEKFGRREVVKMIIIALISQLAMIFFVWIVNSFPSAPFWTLQDSWSQIFGLVPRITVASLIAFYVSENLDAYIYSWFRKFTKGKHLWARNVFSSIPSLLIDSLVFFPIAFLGLMPILPLIIGQTAIKWLVGIINIPFIYLNRFMLKVENVENK